jgi:Protein of unknown function (DUF3237)
MLTRPFKKIAGVVALAGSVATAGNGEPQPPRLTLAFEARITLAPPIEQGVVDGKRTRFIPITGGTIKGPKLNGVILAGGGDWQSIHPDGLTEIYARYSMKADDGTIIAITNPGVRVASPEVIARLAAGEDVDPSLYYFRTTPVFDVATGPHEWMRRSIFVARGIRKPDHVVIEVFEVE